MGGFEQPGARQAWVAAVKLAQARQQQQRCLDNHLRGLAARQVSIQLALTRPPASAAPKRLIGLD